MLNQNLDQLKMDMESKDRKHKEAQHNNIPTAFHSEAIDQANGENNEEVLSDVQ